MLGGGAEVRWAELGSGNIGGASRSSGSEGAGFDFACDSPPDPPRADAEERRGNSGTLKLLGPSEEDSWWKTLFPSCPSSVSS